MYEITWIPLDQLRPADWNANVVAPAQLKKIRASIEEFGIVENLVVRPLETIALGAQPDDVADIPVTQPVPTPSHRIIYEVVSGNHRLQLYRDLGIDPAPCHITQLDRGRAIILGEALNHVRGTNDPDRYNAAIRQALETVPATKVTSLINETKASLDKILGRTTDDDAPPPRSFQHRYEIVIECADEAEQETLYTELAARGLTCRILTL